MKLSDDLFSLVSTIMQISKDGDFNTDNVTKAILADLNLHATYQPLVTQISEISGGPSSFSANRTNVIWHGPPNNNHWRNQNNSNGQH